MSNLDFGPLVLGGNTFGWTSDKDESFAVLDKFVAAGGRSIDTADAYSAWVPGNSGGESESIIGAWLKSRGHREDVVVATKVFSLPSRPGLSPDNIRAAVEESLGRLQTDYLDLYYAHRDDDSVPQDDYLGAFDELVKAGKVREIGASNFTYARLTSANTIAKDNGLTPFTVAQDKYNLVDRGLDAVLPDLAAIGVTELPYSALASGFLTGKYRSSADTAGRPRGAGVAKYLNDRGFGVLKALDEVAKRYEAKPGQIAIAWLIARPSVTAPIASATNLEQLAELVEAAEIELDAESIEKIDAASKPG
jgi:aryl-alcohol dehydrogenase-like predicted oxidoreductase